MKDSSSDRQAREIIARLAAESNLRVQRGRIRRTSSRFCLGVEHGDYNGTELFGVGTDRFIWLAYQPNGTNRVRLYSANFPDNGIIDFQLGNVPAPKSPAIADTWARVLSSNIPGGGMSRSASLCLNLLLTFLEVNGIAAPDGMKIVDMAQAVENDYIGSPCGNLDQIMIYFARDGMGTHYNPRDASLRHVPLGTNAPDFQIVSLDTGTVRPGLEKSTYKIRRAECEELVALGGKKLGFSCLADIRDQDLYNRVIVAYGNTHPHLCDRLRYIFHAQQRFYQMLDAWKSGDIETVGAIFRQDGVGLRDDYRISGPELETMCDIARAVPGVLGERMLGGGDKGAAGALVRTECVAALQAAVDANYPRRYPELAGKHAVHACNLVAGVAVLQGW